MALCSVIQWHHDILQNLTKLMSTCVLKGPFRLPLSRVSLIEKTDWSVFISFALAQFAPNRACAYGARNGYSAGGYLCAVVSPPPLIITLGNLISILICEASVYMAVTLALSHSSSSGMWHSLILQSVMTLASSSSIFAGAILPDKQAVTADPLSWSEWGRRK